MNEKAKMLENRLHVPAALNKYSSGAVIVIGTDIDGGVVLNRKVWMGSSGSAGP